MFKSSFAREIIEETKQNANLDSILSSDLNSAYKSSFAASTHSALDNMPVNIEAVEPRFSLRNINLEDTSAELATSDLGTSDFSSSELWPSSDRQLEDIISGYPSSAASKFGSRVEEKRENNPSFLNLDSQMPFSYLEQVHFQSFISYTPYVSDISTYIYTYILYILFLHTVPSL